MSKLKKMALPEAQSKVREPDNLTVDTPVILMLHGYSGDESSMWVFGAQIPDDALVISLRAPFSSRDVGIGGYTWVDHPVGYWPVYQDFFSGAEFIKQQIMELSKKYQIVNFDRLILVGFSQGGAMAFVFANIYSGTVEKLALLSSFIPDGTEGFVFQEKLSQTQFFIAHGSRDEMVSIDLAQSAKKMISELGSSVIFCEGDVGHQLDADCFKALGKFLLRDRL